MPDKIFISYRRDDVPGDARELRNGLTAKFGRANVFMEDRLLWPHWFSAKGLRGAQVHRDIRRHGAVRFSLFQGSLAELCRAMNEHDDLRNRMRSLMLTVAHNLGGDPYSPTETISEYFGRIIFIPKRHFASWLDKSANAFANEWLNLIRPTAANCLLPQAPHLRRFGR
jgi:hypothetical protein